MNSSSSENDKITLPINNSEKVQCTSKETIEKDVKETLIYDKNPDNLNFIETELKDVSISRDNDKNSSKININTETNTTPEIPEINIISQNSLTEKDIEKMFGSPYHKLQNNVFVEGNMVSYVAPNFNDLLRKERVESPVSSWTQDTSRSPSTESISSTNSGWSTDVKKPISQILNSKNLAPIDPTFLSDLEKLTQELSCHLNHTFNNFITHTNKMSFHALQSLSLYKDSVDSTCDTVDNSIKSMYALMAKCEEVHNNMTPVYHIHAQIKEIKRVLDIFEMQILSEDIK